MALNNFCTKGIYSNGMVLQQNATNCIFGSAKENTLVEMKFCEKKYSTKSDNKGNWKIEYNTQNAGGPFTLELSCESKKIKFSDVYVGEVWVSSGQSNAELQMERLKYSYPDEYILPENKNIRMINIPISWSFDGEKETVENPTWFCANPENLKNMSGTAYFFAKKLNRDLDIPIGIINASQGGSPIESWMNKKSLQELEQNESLTRLKIYENPENIKSKQIETQNTQQKWDKEVAESCDYSDVKSKDGWQNVKIPGDFSVNSAGITWFKKEFSLTKKQVENFNQQKTHLWLGTIVDADTVFVNDVQVGITYYCYPPRRYIVPCNVLKEGKNTIIIKLQKNSKYGKIRFYKDKPYALFTDDVFVMPRTVHSIEEIDYENIVSYQETKKLKASKKSEYIDLTGTWQKKEGSQTSDAPAGMFFEWVPTALFNSMLAPCFNYAISGALWYQGESNATSPKEYALLLPKLISLWREKFLYAKKDFGFVVMQLPGWCDGNEPDKTPELNGGWAEIRDSQEKAVEKTKNSALVVTIDAGEWNDLHPETKRTCGTRAAKQALNLCYNKNYSNSPKMLGVTSKNAILNKNFFVRFDSPLYVKNNKRINGFSVLYTKNNQNYTKRVKAILNDDFTVKVCVPRGLNVAELRYLWEMNINGINLYNKDKSLPVRPFCKKIR